MLVHVWLHPAVPLRTDRLPASFVPWPSGALPLPWPHHRQAVTDGIPFICRTCRAADREFGYSVTVRTTDHQPTQYLHLWKLAVVHLNLAYVPVDLFLFL